MTVSRRVSFSRRKSSKRRGTKVRASMRAITLSRMLQRKSTCSVVRAFPSKWSTGRPSCISRERVNSATAAGIPFQPKT